MLAANLLSAKEKKLVKFEEYRLTVRFFGAGVAVVLTIGLISLAPSYVFLSAEKKNLEETSVAEAAFAQKLKLGEAFSNATRVQTLLAETGAFLGRPSRSSQLIKIFFTDAAGVRVSRLAIDAQGSVMISGFAETRDDLLDFQKRLKDSQILETVVFPISDIIRSTDIHFTMNGKLKSGQGLY